jgi:S1-C subfamily serine protease
MRSLIALALCAAAPAVARAQELPIPQVVQRASPAVVSIKTFDGDGEETGIASGFVIRGGRIVTNAHVVEGAAQVRVYDRDDKLLGTADHAEAISTTSDLAILPSMAPAVPPIALAAAPPEVGESVLAIGAPEGLTNSVSDGIVSAFRVMQGQRVMQITAPLSHGSSGGPVLNRRAELVGVSVAVLRDGQNLNFAVPLADVRALVAAAPGRVAFPAEGATRARGFEIESVDALRRVAVGESVTGALRSGDLRVEGGGWFDAYRLTARSGERVTISVRSNDFDTFVAVGRVGRGKELEVLGSDDDGAGGTNSRLTLAAPSDGEYVIAVRAFDEAETGSYTVLVRRAEAEPARTAAAQEEEDERWLPVSATGAYRETLDRTRIATQGESTYRVWLRRLYQEPTTDQYGDTYDREMMQLDYDCGRRRLRLVQIVQYLGARQIYESDDRPTKWTEWGTTPAGGAGEAVCEYMAP